MRSSIARRATPRIVLALLASLALGACDRALTEPGPTRVRQASAAAAHDDTPPDYACRSGWTQVDGRWTCADGD